MHREGRCGGTTEVNPFNNISNVLHLNHTHTHITHTYTHTPTHTHTHACTPRCDQLKYEMAEQNAFNSFRVSDSDGVDFI